MKEFHQLSFCASALRFVDYGCRMGWHERNAGNISLLLNQQERDEVCPFLTCTEKTIPLADEVPLLAGELVFTTVSGSYFIDLSHDAQKKFCICRVNSEGNGYTLVYGEKPTSELCGHLMALHELKKRNGGRAVYHCHPANVVALSFLTDDKKTLNNWLWKSITECAFVFPEGVGLVPFFVPGSMELARATGEAVKEHNAVLWSHHGLFATGSDIADAFGLAHAIEKAAEIRLKIMSAGIPQKNGITNSELQTTAQYYKKQLDTTLLTDEQ